MKEFQVNYTALANKVMIRKLKTEDLFLARLLEVFDGHNIYAAEAFAIMGEIYDVMNEPEVVAVLEEHDKDTEALGDKLIRDLTNALENSLSEETEETDETEENK